MQPDWDAFESLVQETHPTFAFEAVTFYNYTGGYDPATGETDDWQEDSGVTEQAELALPTDAPMTVGPDGQSTAVRIRLRIPTTTTVTIRPAATTGERATEVETPYSRYVITEQFDEGNGLLLLLGVEA